MVGVSIQFDRLGGGVQSIAAEKILPAHRKILDRYLSAICSPYIGGAPLDDLPVKITFKDGKAGLTLKGRDILLLKNEEFKEIKRIVRYYQHVGEIPSSLPVPGKRLEEEPAVHKTILAVNEAKVPGANGALLAGLRISDQTLTAIRNILFAVPSIGRNDPILNHLGYYAGMFWGFFSFREFDNGVVEYNRAKRIGDTEGLRRAEGRVVSGAVVSAGSLAYLGGKFCETLSVPAAASAALGASNVLFGAGALLAVGISALGAIRCERFQSRLNEYLDNPNLTEVQKMQGALRFLKDSISVTVEERHELSAEIDEKYPHLSEEKKGALLRQKIEDLTEVKVKYIKRRTSNQTLRLILNHADDLIVKLNSNEHRNDGIKEGSVLFNKIRQENRIKLSLYVLSLIASILGFVGMVLMTVASAGSLPFILFGVSGTVYLGITLYTAAGVFIPKNEPILELPGGAPESTGMEAAS